MTNLINFHHFYFFRQFKNILYCPLYAPFPYCRISGYVPGSTLYSSRIRPNPIQAIINLITLHAFFSRKCIECRVITYLPKKIRF